MAGALFLFSRAAGPWNAAADNGRDGPAAAVPVSIEFRTSYETCGHTEKRHVTSWLPARDATSVAAAYPGWRLAGRAGDEYVFERQESGLCTDDRFYRHLSVVDGRVAVFLGKPGHGARLKEMTDIAVSGLLAEDRARLEQGITVLGDDAVRSYLEGLGE